MRSKMSRSEKIMDDWQNNYEQRMTKMYRKYSSGDLSALKNFHGCHDRVASGKVHSIEFARTAAGFVAFCKELGPKPTDGKTWSVGRKDHKFGYVRDNIEWQTLSDNCAEANYRRWRDPTFQRKKSESSKQVVKNLKRGKDGRFQKRRRVIK